MVFRPNGLIRLRKNITIRSSGFTTLRFVLSLTSLLYAYFGGFSLCRLHNGHSIFILIFLYPLLTTLRLQRTITDVNNQRGKKTMIKLNFSVDVEPTQLRNLALTLEGMAAQVERNIDITVDDEEGYLGLFPIGHNGGEIEVYLNTPLTIRQAVLIPPDILEKHIGEITDDTEQTAADAFGDDNEKKTNTVTDVELDAEGLPWDARIHGSKKTKLARGNTWKLKRGIDPAEVETVIAELRLAIAPVATANSNFTNIDDAKPAGPATPAQPAGPGGPAVPVVKYVTDDGEWTREQLIAARYTNEQIDALPITGQTVVATVMTFPELMQRITPALTDGTITDAQVTAACVKNGVDSIALVSARPDLVPAIKIDLFG